MAAPDFVFRQEKLDTLEKRSSQVTAEAAVHRLQYIMENERKRNV